LDCFSTAFKLGEYYGVMMGRQLAGSNIALVYKLRSVLHSSFYFSIDSVLNLTRTRSEEPTQGSSNPKCLFGQQIPCKFLAFFSACDSQKQPKLALKL